MTHNIYFTPFESEDFTEAFPLFKTYLCGVIDEAFGWNEAFQHEKFHKSLHPEWFHWVMAGNDKIGIICHRFKAHSL